MNRLADSAEREAWPTCINPGFKSSIRHFHELLSWFVLEGSSNESNAAAGSKNYHTANQKRLRRIAMISIQINGNVDINYVAIF
jgi:hypothetical protein